MANVRIEGVAKQYAGRKILSGLSLELNDGECFTRYPRAAARPSCCA
jgi:ABC-type multidrug transport system ATPase subunit